jgi:hypothetical protein
MAVPFALPFSCMPLSYILAIRHGVSLFVKMAYLQPYASQSQFHLVQMESMCLYFSVSLERLPIALPMLFCAN